MASNRERWNELYQRSDRLGRPRAEVDSVPQAHHCWAMTALDRPDYQWWMQHVQPGVHMLDLGCGNGGYLASMVMRYRGTGVGIDISDVAIEAGRDRLRSAGLGGRMTLEQQSFHDELPAGPFDLVYSLYAMQFARASQLPRLARGVASRLRAGGLFCVKVRSTSRSVHDSYVPLDGEPNTYISHEPHELGMVYHHYSKDDIALFARLLNGTVLHAEERKEHRDYDRHADRAWWQVVIRAGSAG